MIQKKYNFRRDFSNKKCTSISCKHAYWLYLFKELINTIIKHSYESSDGLVLGWNYLLFRYKSSIIKTLYNMTSSIILVYEWADTFGLLPYKEVQNESNKSKFTYELAIYQACLNNLNVYQKVCSRPLF